jgi:Holliday junction resolvase-like predicted endonuclease
MHPRIQGDFGEMSGALWLTAQGAVVSKPIGHCPDYDLIADFGDRICRVEVKTTTRRTKLGRWCAQLCTHGGNQSWTGTTKLFEPARCDYVYVHVGDGRRWFLPSWALDGARTVTLGGEKYSECEVAPGDPIPDRTQRMPGSTIGSR